MAAGAVDAYAPARPAISPTSMFGNPATFTGAANTQAGDYDNIMQQYRNLAQRSISNPITPGEIRYNDIGGPNPIYPSSNSQIGYNAIAPQTAKYNQSQDVTRSLSDLSNLADTGGYSAADIANIRERDISPIRSIYANARENTERAKALSGGYSPNYNAVSAKMARQEADKIGDVTTAANAGIAQNVAANKIAATPAYANAAGSANRESNDFEAHNADIVNQINELNAKNKLAVDESNRTNANSVAEFNAQGRQRTDEFNAANRLEVARTNEANRLAAATGNRAATQSAIAGQASLYGTTPALVNTFGNQVAQATQLGQNQQQINNQRDRNLYGFVGGAS